MLVTLSIQTYLLGWVLIKIVVRQINDSKHLHNNHLGDWKLLPCKTLCLSHLEFLCDVKYDNHYKNSMDQIYAFT